MTKLWSLGDSISRGYPANQNIDQTLYGTNPGGQGDAIALKVWNALSPLYANVQVAAGLGYTMGDSLPGSFGDISSLEANPVIFLGNVADTVILEGGTNDLGVQQTDVQTIASIQARCTSLMSKPFATVVLWTIPPRGDWPSAGGAEEPRVTAGGSGYSTAPTVGITGTGTGATATARVEGGAVVGIDLTAIGSGYTGSVTVSLTGGGGTGATATSKPSTGGPYGGAAAGQIQWTDQKETYRLAVNAWIRASAVDDGYCHLVYDPEAWGVTNPAGSLYTDLLHFSEVGCTLHAASLANVISGIHPAPPAPTFTATPDDPSTASVSFSFTDADPEATFECSLDGGSYAACTSPKTYSGLADGSHTFAVRAVNIAGPSSPASFSWDVVVVLPTPSAGTGAALLTVA